LKIIGIFRKPYFLCLLLGILALAFLRWMPTDVNLTLALFGNPPPAATRGDIQLALDYMSGVEKEDLPVFSTLIRTYKIVPSTSGIWPEATGPVSYWGGDIVERLAFQNIVMLAYDGEIDFERLAVSSGDSAGYVQRYNVLHKMHAISDNSCYFERFFSRRRWITKGVIIVDLTKSDLDRQKLLIECASAGADFINGLPSASNRATLADMPPPRVRAVLNDALYRCSLKGATRMRDPEASNDGLTERPSRSCLIDHLNGKLRESAE
jgi:hypothetical protein